MIGYLQGTIQQVGETGLVLLTTGGVGYEVNLSSRLLNQAEKGQEANYYIYTHVKEDQLNLFGFKTIQEKKLFQLLLSVSGVGPSTALNISNLGAETIVQAVQEAQVKTFTAIPRVGKKLAQKIIIELKSKLGSLRELELGEITGPAHELVEALIALGFDEQRSYQVAREYETDNRSIEIILKEAIQKLK